MATHSSILAGKSHGQRMLVGYSPWGHKELNMTELLHFLSFFLSLVIVVVENQDLDWKYRHSDNECESESVSCSVMSYCNDAMN